MLADRAVRRRRTAFASEPAAIAMRPTRSRFARLLSSAAIIGVLGVATAACQTTQTTQSTDTTGSIVLTPPTVTEDDWRRDIQIYGPQYRADPSNVAIGLRYAQALRATGQSAQAVAIL